MATKLSSRQTINNATLTRVTAAAGSQLDTILASLDSLTTPPFVMTPSSPADQKVNIGAATVTNSVIGANSTTSPLSGGIPSFSSGYVTFPTTSGGNAVPSAGSNLAITVSSGNFIKVGIAIDTTNNINLTVGTQGASIAAAGTPSVPSSTIPVGFVVLQNIGGTIQTVTGSRIYQYVGSGGGGGGSGYTTSLITASTTAVSGTQYLTDITTGSQTITLPTGATNARVMVSDATGNWGNFPVTVTTTGGQLINVNGATDTSMILNVKGTWVEFIWSGSYWSTDDAYFPVVTVLSVSQYVDLTNQSSTPAAPNAGISRVYTKTDGNLYRENSGGTETLIGPQPDASVSVSGVVNTTAQSFAGVKTFTSGLKTATYEDFTAISTPAAPSSGDYRLYFKSDGNAYKQTPGGVETQLGGGMTLSLQTASFSAVSNFYYVVTSTGGAVTVTLPTSSLPGTVIRFADSGQTWGKPNSVTLNAGSNNIFFGGSIDTSLVLNLPGTWVELAWDTNNNRWDTVDGYWPLNNQLTGDLTVQGNLTVTGSFSQVYPIKTSVYTAIAGDFLMANTASAAFSITLPASPTAGQNVRIFDAKGTWATNNLTVLRNGSNINGVATDLTGNVNNSQLILVYIDSTTGWKVYT